MSATYVEASGATGPQTIPGGEPLPDDETLDIADALMTEMPGFDIDSCGHCKAVFTCTDPTVLRWTRPLERLRHLAYAAGWDYDADRTWCCPGCQASTGWKAAHRAVEVSPQFCERHDSPDGGRRPERCTCPAAVLAVDVMLTSCDYPDIFKAFDRKATAIMTARGAGWDYARWRERWALREPGQHRGTPAAEQAAA